jgi:predicted nucleotide-binding protein
MAKLLSRQPNYRLIKMKHYIVIIELIKEEAIKHGYSGAYSLGHTKESINKEIAEPYNQKKPFWFAGRHVLPDEVFIICIFPYTCNDDLVLFPNKKGLFEQEDFNYIMDCLTTGRIPNVGLDISEKILHPSEDLESPKPEDLEQAPKRKEKIFIVHGTDEASAILLQKHLTDKGINAEMFEDFKKRMKGNTTVIEELMKIKEEISYAFIIATPDDRGSFHEEIEEYVNGLVKGKSTVDAKDVCAVLDRLNFRTRQNVLFEYGLFLGVLGREKVECLWNKRIGEEPSDIKSVLNIQFEKSIKETFPEIDAKLDKIIPKKS